MWIGRSESEDGMDDGDQDWDPEIGIVGQDSGDGDRVIGIG